MARTLRRLAGPDALLPPGPAVDDRLDRRRSHRVDHLIFVGRTPYDLPLLERANDPVATNPSPALEAVAQERGWRILRLFA